MYCKYCGHELPEGSRFCVNCGKEQICVFESEENDSTEQNCGAEQIDGFESAGNDSLEHAGAEFEEGPDKECLTESVSSADGGGKKHRKWVFIAIGAVILIAVAAVTAVSIMPTDEERFQKQYDLGEQYLLELDYEQAVVAFTAAIEIDPNVTDAYLGRAEAYLASGETGDNLTAALSDYDTVLELDDSIIDVYMQEADIYITLGDYDSALEIVERGQQVDSENADLSEKKQQVGILIEAQEQAALVAKIRQQIEDVYWDEIWSFIEIVEDRPDDLTDADWYSEELEALISTLPEAIFWETDEGYFLGVYPNGIYYGDMSEGYRTGYGIWIFNSSDFSCIYIGEWSDDYPNGNGTLYECLWNSDGSGFTYTCLDITFVDGNAQGSGTLLAKDSLLTEEYLECDVMAEDGELLCIYDEPWADTTNSASAIFYYDKGSTLSFGSWQAYVTGARVDISED